LDLRVSRQRELLHSLSSVTCAAASNPLGNNEETRTDFAGKFTFCRRCRLTGFV
jgi:hypothetical protein